MKKLALIFLLSVVLVTSLKAQVTEEAYNPARTSVTNSETVLNPSDVNTTSFGKLFSQVVDQSILAQPLYVPNLMVNDVAHNVVFIATMNNTVYAFDADTQQSALWQITLGTASTDKEGIAEWPKLGILSTPYIDLPNNKMYVVTYTTENSMDLYRLHVLDIRTGVETTPSVIIGGSNQGFVFDSTIQMQRPGLAFANGSIIITFGSFSDAGSYHGWIFSYSTSLIQTGILVTTTFATGEGGIWMSGRAPVVDSAGNVYNEIANGAFDGGMSNYGMTFLKTSPTSQVLDWWVPYSFYDTWNPIDEDLGSAGPLLIPGTNYLVGGNKAGINFLLNTSNMGHFAPALQQIADGGAGFFKGGIWTGPAFFNNKLYMWPNAFPLQVYTFNGTSFNTVPQVSTDVAEKGSYGAGIAISANAGTNGIVWAYHPTGMNTFTRTELPGLLIALDASTLNELWNSNTVLADNTGLWSKWREPVIQNGKVYVGSTASADGSKIATLSVYGLKGPAPLPPTGLTVTLHY